MRKQTETAIETADISLFVYDAREGVTPLDERFAQLVRKSNKPVVLVANKCEGRHGEPGLMEAWRLGLGDAVPMSAEHGEGLSDLYEAIVATGAKGTEAPEEEAIKEDGEEFDPDAEAPPEDPAKPIRIAFVGRPNAGKSTLLNQILGDDRFVTGPEAGITRDAVSVQWSWGGREMKLVDTAGLRKRARVQEKLEKASTHETIHAIQFSDVVVLVMDPRDAFEKQDLQIANLVLREGRGIVFCVTKWDTIEDPVKERRELERLLNEKLPHAKGAPLACVSGVTGRNIDRMMDSCLKVYKDWSARVKTRDLNDWLKYVTQKHPPPAPDGKRIKPRYMAQMKTRPPTFVLMASRGNDMPETYKRYLINELREAFDMPGVPIRLFVRQGKNPYADE